MKSIIFCNQSDEFFDREFRPTIEQQGIEIILIMRSNGDGDADFSLEEFDLFIIFQDMVLKSQIDILKNFAKKCKKPYVLISKRCTNLSQEISITVKKLTTPPVNVTQSEISSKEKLDNHATEQQSIDVFKKDDAINELQKLLAEEHENSTTLLDSLRKKDKIISEQKELLSLYEIENNRLTQKLKMTEKDLSISAGNVKSFLEENTKFIEVIKSLKQQVSDFQRSQNNEINIRQEILAIHDLNKEGLLSDSEVLERFLLIGGLDE